MNGGADLEREWRVRVEAARQRYLESKKASDEAERSALDEYNRTLRIYADLILYGKVPGEPGS